MATVINTTPGTTTDNNSGLGFLMGVILLVAFVLLMIFYVVPYLGNSVGNGGGGAPQTNVQVPQQPQIQVPDKINVDVNPKK